MKRLTVALCLCAALVLPALADSGEVVSARLAAYEFPVPTFAELHLAFVRICANESGFFSLPDQDGILQAMLFGGGGGRKAGRNKKGMGYGLDYAKLMRRMGRHSKRTFPSDSKFLLVTDAMRVVIASKQTFLNKWTSTLELDCQRPAGWPEKARSGRPMLSWPLVVQGRCELLVRTTRQVLKGRVESYCDDQPTTWGSEADVEREGGPLDKGWTEVHCDRPPATPESCGKMTKDEIWASTTGCARNTFWTWITKDKEADSGDKEESAAGSRGGEGDSD